MIRPSFVIACVSICLLSLLHAAPVVFKIGDGRFSRELTFDGKAWRTTRFVSVTGSMEVRSDEFHIRLMDDREWTVSDFVAEKDMIGTSNGESTTSLTIRYRWPDAVPPGAPDSVVVR
ncbi:MAG: hypothetical protein CFE26_19490, partial [Verrucomicrobiales bacterium VVV1]